MTPAYPERAVSLAKTPVQGEIAPRNADAGGGGSPTPMGGDEHALALLDALAT